jgi:hypothetical protein
MRYQRVPSVFRRHLPADRAGFCLRLIRRRQEVFGQVAFPPDLCVVRTHLLSQDVGFDLPSFRHVPQIDGLLAIVKPQIRQVLLGRDTALQRIARRLA